MEKLIEIKDFSVKFETGRAVAYALNGVNLTIGRGEALGLVGESGAGKTTTALGMLNLIPQPAGKVTGGDILYEGKSVFKMSQKELMDMRGDKVAMIFQNPLTSLNPVFTVGEQIGMVLQKHKNLSKKEAVNEAGKLLEVVGIAKYRVNDFPHQFSGGMRQRVGIAAALACNPSLLIADEPTTALDVTIQAQILELMKELLVKYDSSLLMITHNLGIIAEICNNVAVMYAGIIVEYGSVEEVFTNPSHPYTIGLFGSIPKLTGPRERLASIPGTVANPEKLPSGCPFHERCGEASGRCSEHSPRMFQIGENHYVACHKAGEVKR
ncbi:ABC transporter ATP-binding protein [Lacrimispora indolis]|uniref:ABC transporter ATP-binding protein n=1 Tax=Lacrimispora indolis TaxID=69825 RepID=UPI00042A2DD7|nr:MULTISPECIES: ABC transporter ATP-binding protein [Lachnospiraceae]MBE7722839.1 ABC transporter ATP-binding protein [Lacrimispora celerecrescens]